MDKNKNEIKIKITTVAALFSKADTHTRARVQNSYCVHVFYFELCNI